MLGFVIGVIVGGSFGILMMALMTVASDADDRSERMK